MRRVFCGHSRAVGGGVVRVWCGFTSRSFVSVIPLYCGNSLWHMLKLGKVFAIEYVVGFLRAPSIGISLTDADHDQNQPGFIF